MTLPGEELAGRVALVTGAARGQGAAHARALAAAGASILAFDLCQSPLYPSYPLAGPEDLAASAAAVEAAGGACLAVEGDVRSPDAVGAAVAACRDRFGRLDIVVNNAGICGIAPFDELSDGAWNAMMDTNVKGPWLVCRAALASLRESDAGRIVNTGSVATLRGLAGMSHYVASKHALLGLTRTLAIELAGDGITVNCVSPGTADTDLDAGVDLGMEPGQGKVEYAKAHLTGRMIAPREISRIVCMLASPEAGSITGQNFVIDGGWSA